MKICTEDDPKEKGFPKVKGGDLIEVKGTQDDGLYLVMDEDEVSKVQRLVMLADGVVWNPQSLWGSTLRPLNVRLVTDEYCIASL